jgi:hypothetical protein
VEHQQREKGTLLAATERHPSSADEDVEGPQHPDVQGQRPRFDRFLGSLVEDRAHGVDGKQAAGRAPRRHR